MSGTTNHPTMATSQLERYRRLNEAHRRSLVFNLGSEGGFYSEFNNMILAILYCLKYKYRFVLYSDSSNFRISKGWTDFFEPFCPEAHGAIHRRINKRTAELPGRKSRLLYKAYKLLTSNVMTFEIWSKFFNLGFEKERFEIPELGISGDLRHAASRIVPIVYRFNEDTRIAIEASAARLRLPQHYAALNIRRGDKDTEIKHVDVTTFLDRLDAGSALKDVFVFTDDYSIIEELRALRPDTRFYTLTEPQERGYFHQRFAALAPSQKVADLVKMFAAIELMSRADFAVGTFTANPGIFLGMRMPDDRFTSVQRKTWSQFQSDDIREQLTPAQAIVQGF